VITVIPPERLERLRLRLRHWSAGRGMGFAGVFLGAALPLGVLGGQMLYAAQPVLNLFFPPQEISDLARLLSDPAGIRWLRATLDHDDQEGEEA